MLIGLTPSTRATQATDRLRDLILGGQFKSGERLKERALAAEVGVSRTPIRNALQALSAEGLVVYSPHSGYTVRRFAAEDAAETFEAWFAIDGMAARLAAGSGLDPELEDRLRVNIEACHRTIGDDRWDEGRQRRWLALNFEFHEMVVVASENRLLLQFAHQARWPVDIAGVSEGTVSMFEGFRDEDRRRAAQRALGEHQGILDAIMGRQADEAERLMRDHLSHNQRRIRGS